MEKIKEIWDFGREIIKNVIIAGIVIHTGTQLTYWGNNLYHRLNPSEIRMDFEEKYGIRIVGWEKDIEGNRSNIAKIAQVLDRENIDKKVELKSIRIRSNYLRQPFFDQIRTVFCNPTSGYYISNKIVLDDFVRKETVHHESKHDKIKEVMKNNPKCLEKWKALAINENGESLYLTTTESELFISKIKVLRSLIIDSTKQIYSENEKLGFVTNYARTNIREDCAELGEMAETDYSPFIKWLFGNDEEENKIIMKKVDWEQENAIIPKEFTEYLELEKILSDHNLKSRQYINLKETQTFMDASLEFLRKYPKSVYESELRYNRANILSRTNSQYPKKIEDILGEYLEVLNSEYKDKKSYTRSLELISRIYRSEFKNEEVAEIYKKAILEYSKRFDGGNLHLSTIGVNDYLIENGIKLD